MTPTPRNILSTPPFLIIAILQVRTMWRIDGESGGLGSFLVVVGWIICISFVVAHVWKWERTKETTPFNPIPLWMLLASAALSLAAGWYRDYRLHCPDRYKVQSHQRQTGKPDRLNLKMNGSYIAEMNEGYRQSGSDSIHHDRFNAYCFTTFIQRLY